MKKFLLFMFVFIIVIGFFTPLIHVQGVMIDGIEIPEETEEIDTTITVEIEEEKPPVVVTPATQDTGLGTEGDYILLEPLPCPAGADGCPEGGGQLTKFDTTGTSKLGMYLNIMIRLFIGLCAVAAVVMIVIAGVEYSTSELISNKEAAKERIRNAILGLLLALGSYTILYTINPDLLNTDVDISGATIVSEGEQRIADLEEIVTDVGPGTTVNGKNVVMQKGGAAPCSTNLVTLGGKVPASPKYRNAPICPDLLGKLTELKKIFPNFEISSMIRNKGSISGCHYSGAKGGNCADIIVTNGDWDGLCLAIMAVGGLNFGNEATNKGECQKLKEYKLVYDKNGKLLTTGPHLHVNYRGGGVTYGQTQTQTGKGSCQAIKKTTGEFGVIITDQTSDECNRRNKPTDPYRYVWRAPR